MTGDPSGGGTTADTVPRLVDRLPALRWIRLVAATVGVASLVAAVVVVTGLGGERVTRTVTAVVRPSRGVLAAFAFLSGVVAVVALLRGRRDAGRREVRLPAPPDRADDEDSVVGAEFDDSLDRGIDSAPDADWWQGVGVEDEIRSLALVVLRDDGGYGVDEAADALETGSWTDDPRAATYLGTENHCSIGTRVRDWFGGAAATRQVEATLAELAAIAGVDLGPADVLEGGPPAAGGERTAAAAGERASGSVSETAGPRGEASGR